MPFSQNNLRNIAIIAHVDHGKTTLVDGLLKQANVFAAHQSEMQQTTILDMNDLERERGVTILAKNTAVIWGEYKINILDTPGHADFSGEVERVLNMADGCLLLVDASEGVLSQTRYVLRLAIEQGLKPIVVINKVDRKDQRVTEVLEEINDLFLDVVNDESQLDFPVIYAVGREGVAGFTTEPTPDHALRITDSETLKPLFTTIIDKIPAPAGAIEGGFQMQITSLDADDYKGKYVIGRIRRGKVKKGEVLSIVRDDAKVGQSKVEYLFTYKGLGKEEVAEASVGDIIALTGFQAHIGDTLTTLGKEEGLGALSISEPTVQMQFSVSNSPFVGREGQFSTSRQILERLTKELETNVGLRVAPGATADGFIVSGRGELHLSILIETMRREGYEFSVSRPEVIFKTVDGVTQEPWELITIEVPEQYVGVVTTEMGQRKAVFKGMKPQKTGTRMEYEIATRHLIGFRSDFQTKTSGMGIVHSLPLGYKPKGEDIPWLREGVIIAAETGPALAYGLQKAQERGMTFVDPGTEVYAGMIVGQNAKKEDLVMNVTRGKKLTNMRAASADATVRMTPPVKMSLEQMLTFLAPDELLEVTPESMRLRKRDLKVANR
ncbi:MAG TPA: translational GTPase TypA [Vitreimonas sp.]|nr:translational GTPase TypA [Vitreimonas sp.]